VPIGAIVWAILSHGVFGKECGHKSPLKSHHTTYSPAWLDLVESALDGGIFSSRSRGFREQLERFVSDPPRKKFIYVNLELEAQRSGETVKSGKQ